MGASAIADVIWVYGGWGMSAVLMVALGWMTKYVLKYHDEIRKTLVDIIEKKVQAETMHTATLDSLKEALRNLSSR